MDLNDNISEQTCLRDFQILRAKMFIVRLFYAGIVYK